MRRHRLHNHHVGLWAPSASLLLRQTRYVLHPDLRTDSSLRTRSRRGLWQPLGWIVPMVTSVARSAMVMRHAAHAQPFAAATFAGMSLHAPSAAGRSVRSALRPAMLAMSTLVFATRSAESLAHFPSAPESVRSYSVVVIRVLVCVVSLALT
jgi:hypothetical protein